MQNVLVLKKSHALADVLQVIDENSKGFVILIEEDYTLIGLITDGDVRRAVLNNRMDLPNVINTKPLVFLEDHGKQEASKYLKSKGIRILPIVNTDNKLVDIIYDGDVHFKSNKVVIMAGGLGSRMGSLTKDTPKPMLLVGGKPLLENIINSFLNCGFNNFIICVNFKSNIIEDYFKDGSKWDANISYVREDKRMGTAGALSLIKSKFKKPFFVVNGDILTTVKYDEFLDFHESKKSTATMGVKRYEYQLPYAAIKLDKHKKISEISEKPVYTNLINAGVYVLSSKIISFVPKNKFYDMPTLLEKMVIESNNVFTYSIDEYWLDIGHESDYEKANGDITKIKL